MDSIERWEIFGVFFILVLGMILHSLYELVQIRDLAWLMPVNESIFEHSKMAFYPLLILTAIQYLRSSEIPDNLFYARAVELGIFFIIHQLLFMIIYFQFGMEQYGTTLEIIFSVFIFSFGIIIGQYTAYQIIKRNYANSLRFKILAIIFIIVYFCLIVVMTYRPIQNRLFWDPVNDLYGIASGNE